MKRSSIKKILLIIILSAAVLFFVLYFLRLTARNNKNAEVERKLKNKIELLGITQDDHIAGPRDADIFIIEYADVNCPYCRHLHKKLAQMVENKNIKIAWVYRHFPLFADINKIDGEERALECAAVQGGDSIFFNYLKNLISRAVEKENFTKKQLIEIAQTANLNIDLFDDCLSRDTWDSRILHDHTLGAVVGISAIPHVFFVAYGSTLREVVGNKPLSVYEGIINFLQQ